MSRKRAAERFNGGRETGVYCAHCPCRIGIAWPEDADHGGWEGLFADRLMTRVPRPRGIAFFFTCKRCKHRHGPYDNEYMARLIRSGDRVILGAPTQPGA